MVTLVWLYIMKCATIRTTEFALLVNKSLSDCKMDTLPYKKIEYVVACCYYFSSTLQIMELFQDRLMDMALTVTQPHQKLVRMPL